VLAAVEVPEVEVAARGSANTAGTEAPQGHTVPRAIVEVAGVADSVRVVPPFAGGPVPGAGGDFGFSRLVAHVVDFISLVLILAFLLPAGAILYILEPAVAGNPTSRCKTSFSGNLWRN
jgi:hypothetical protein